MKHKNRVFISLLVFVLVFLVGVAGFKFIGGGEWSLLDSVYMTVITITTIGYGEVHDLSLNPAARVFGTVYIILCLGTIAFAVSSITAFVVEGELKNILGRRKMEKDISRLREHYIVCGSDGTAQTVIQELVQTCRPFIVVEPAKEKIEHLLRSWADLLYEQGDPAEDSVLVKAGIERAKGIILSLPTDEANLFVAITARSLNPAIRIVAKGIDVRSHNKMVKAGADAVISPSYIGGMRMVSEMVRPAVVTFLDMMLRDREKGLRVEEVRVGEGSKIIGKTIAASGLSEKRGALLVAVKKSATKDYEFNPPGERLIEKDDVLIFIANPGMIQELAQLAGK